MLIGALRRCAIRAGTEEHNRAPVPPEQLVHSCEGSRLFTSQGGDFSRESDPAPSNGLQNIPASGSG